uniref:Uncharacterized protein n=1 Tax=Bos taurus TaxID=9913 RepID=A0AAA9SBK1_BOVIN
MFRKRRANAWAGSICTDSPIAKVKVNSGDHARAKSIRKLDKHSRWAGHFLLTSLFKLEDKSFALSLDSASLIADMAARDTASDDYPTIAETSDNSQEDSMSQTNEATLYYPQGSSRNPIVQDDYQTIAETSANSQEDSMSQTNEATLYYPQGSSRNPILQVPVENKVLPKSLKTVKPQRTPRGSRKDGAYMPSIDDKVKDIMRLLCSVSEKRKIKVAFKYPLLGGLVSGTVATVGGLVGGLPGIVFGGAVGGLLGSWVMNGKFKPVPQIIMELPADKQKRLFMNTIAILRNPSWTSVEQLTMLVMGSKTLQKQLVDMLNNYFIKELGLEMK